MHNKNNNRIINFFFYFFLVFCTIKSSSSSRVLELSDRFLDIRKDGVWLVKFYAPWCGHCKKLEPIYSQVAQALVNTPVRVGRVDCTRFPGLAKEFKVQGFPTVMFIKPSSSHVYNGDRSTIDMVAYAKRMMGDAVKPLEELEITADEPYLVYKGEKRGVLWEEFEKVGGDNQHDLGFFVEEGGGSGDEVEIHLHHPSITTTKSEAPIRYVSSSQDLQTFITSNKFPRFVKITRNNFQEVMSTNKLIVMGVVEEDKLGRIQQPEFVALLEKFVEERGSQFAGHQFGYTPSPSIANSVAMTTLPLPSLLVINSTTYQHHIHHVEDMTADMLGEVLHQIATNQLIPLGGTSLWNRVYRTYYELKTNLGLMFAGNPVLTTLMFGLPLGFLSLIFYSICCSEVLEGEDEMDEDAMEEEDELLHEKKE